MPDITRHTPKDAITVTVGATEGAAVGFSNRFYSGAMMLVPSTYTAATSFRFYVGSTLAGTYYEWLPSDPAESNPVTVAAGKGTDIPRGLFSAKFIKIVNAGGAGTIYVDPKG